jgi:hypothetical protein
MPTYILLSTLTPDMPSLRLGLQARVQVLRAVRDSHGTGQCGGHPCIRLRTRLLVGSLEMSEI